MARSFAGGTDTIRFIDDASDHYSVPGITGCTIAVRIKTTSAVANVQVVGHWTAASRQGFALLMSSAGKIGQSCYNVTSNVGGLASTTSVNNGAWHTVFAVMRFANGALNEVFIDGVSEGTFNASALWGVAASNTFVMGDSLDAFWGSYTGELADVTYWSEPLTAGDAAAYHSGISGCRIQPTKLLLYTPLVRDTLCRRGSVQTSISGTTVSDHPRVIGSMV